MSVDIYAVVTDRIVSALEAGVAPWVRPWHAEIDPVPINAQSRRPYRGINNVVLQLEAASRGYERNCWLTYRQAGELGAQVRQGETGTPIVFWKLHKVRAAGEHFPERDEDDVHERIVPLVRAFTVFNVAQIDGLPADLADARPSVSIWQDSEAVETVIEATGADIRVGGSRACYSPALDFVQMPARSAFPDATAWYGTLLHELAHWTGHKTRLDRQLASRFGTEAYAVEELVAELSSAFTCASLRIDGKLQHAEYIGSWIKVLRGDKRAVFVASAKAQHAADYLLEPVRPEQVEALKEAA